MSEGANIFPNNENHSNQAYNIYLWAKQYCELHQINFDYPTRYLVIEIMKRTGQFLDTTNEQWKAK